MSFSEGSMIQGSSGRKRMRSGIATAEVVLSAREEEILVWVAEGKTNIEISRIFAISPFTVKNHVQSIIRKLGASNRTEAAVKFLQSSVRQTRTGSVGPVAGYADPSV